MFNAAMQGRIRRGDARGGFMLVEVLATMTISALLLAALFSIASLTSRTFGRIERHTEEIEQRTRLLAALSREVERAVPVKWAGKDAAYIFNGTARRLAFAAEIPSPDGATNVTAILIESTRGVTRRTAQVEPGAASFDEIAIGRPETMAGSRYRLAFAYYARLPDGREALLDNWPDARQMPVAVRLTVSRQDGTTSVLRVRLGADAEPGCGFPKTGRCDLAPGATPGEEAAFRAVRGDGG